MDQLPVVLAMLRGQPDDTWGSMVLFLKKKIVQKNDEKMVCSANCKKESLFTKLGENGIIWEEKNCVFLCLRGKKGLFLVRGEKSLHRGNTLAPPPPQVSSGPPLTVRTGAIRVISLDP